MAIFPASALLLASLVVACGGGSPARPAALVGTPPSVLVEAPLPAPPPPVSDEPGPLGPGWLGVELAIDPEGLGAEVRSVLPDSPAEAAGVVAGDLVTAVDGEAVRTPAELSAIVRERGAGARVGLVLQRQGRPRLLVAKLQPRPEADELLRREFIGRRAPDFGPLAAGPSPTPMTLGGYRGRVVVLEFWAPWCGVCRLLAPVLSDWHERIVPLGGMVLGISSDSGAGTSAGVRELGIGHPVLADEVGITTARYRAFALPTLFVIDGQGVVRQVLVGYDVAGLAALMREVDSMLGRHPPHP